MVVVQCLGKGVACEDDRERDLIARRTQARRRGGDTVGRALRQPALEVDAAEGGRAQRRADGVVDLLLQCMGALQPFLGGVQSAGEQVGLAEQHQEPRHELR